VSLSPSTTRRGTSTRTLLAAIFLGVLPAHASAQSFNFNPGPINAGSIFSVCASQPAPTREQCLDEDYLNTLCGMLQSATCRPYQEAEYRSQHARSSLELRRVPANFAADAADAVNQPESHATDNPVLDPASFAKIRHYEEAWAKKRVVTPFFNFRNAVASVPGTNTCYDYVYDKYYDLLIYEDYVDWLSTTSRGAYDIAFDAASNPAAVGTRHASDSNLRGNDGRVFGRLFGQRRARNALFDLPSDDSWVDRVDTVVPGISPDVARLRAALAQREPALMAKVTNNTSTYVETLAWHRSMSDTLARISRPELRLDDGTVITTGYLDEELDDLEQLQREWRKLVTKWTQLHTDPPLSVQARTTYFCEGGGIRLPGGGVTDPLPFGGAVPLSASFSCVPDLRARLAEIKWLHEYYDQQRSLLLDEMVALLRRADGARCLERGTTPCDWSPSMFVDRMTGTFADAMEADFQTCLASVPNAWTFSALKSYTFAFPRELKGGIYNGIQNRDYTATPASVETFFRDLAGYRAELHRRQVEAAKARLMKEKTLVDPRTGELRPPGFERAGSDNLGNKYFGVSYDYKLSWGVTGFENMCNLHGLAHTHFKSDATVLKQTVPLLDAEASADIRKAHAHLKVLGKNIFDPVDEDFIDGNRSLFNFARSFESDKDAASAAVSFTFVIVAVPITVSLGVAGQVGAELGLQLATRGFDSRGECEDNGGFSLGMSGHAEPWARVDGFATAAAGRGLEVGVKGEILVLKASLPSQIAVDVNVPDQASSDDMFRIKNKISLELSTLDGRLAGFVKLFALSAEKTIVRWKGLSWDETLFDRSYQLKASDFGLAFGPEP
jgi:hypothetical protein